LEVRGVRPDDFSDLPALLQKREEQVNRLAVLKRYFEQFGRFDNNESLILKNVTLDQVRQWTPGIKGNDVDAISFAAIGFNLTESQNRFTYRGFPAELRSAFLIYAFEQYRKGAEVPVLPKDHEGDYVFKNQEVKKFLQVLEFYLTHYQEEARKKNPNAVLSVFNLVTFFEKYVDSKAT
jgi:hypothetical protein